MSNKMSNSFTLNSNIFCKKKKAFNHNIPKNEKNCYSNDKVFFPSKKKKKIF